MNELRAGVATVDITPPIGSWLCGFGNRASGCTGIHDPLRLTALVLDDGATPLAIVTADILSFSASMVSEIRRDITRRARPAQTTGSQSERTVQRPGVQVQKSESLRHGTRSGALTGTGRTIDRYDHPRLATFSISANSSQKPGYDTLTQSRSSNSISTSGSALNTPNAMAMR